VERARAVKPDFSLTRENAQSVAAICARLDGLPLGIELAAARIKLLSPAAMLIRLESSLDLLTGGARDLPLRQQTLRATVQWSYRLLNAGEQTLFRRLSVFVGGCTLDGIEAVCNTRGDIGLDVLEGMASMVDKSLVQQVEQAAETRFLMLSTIREFARECMAESGETAATRRAHAAYYLVLAEEGAQDSVGHTEWHERFELEHDNLRRALEYLIENGDVEWGFRMGGALFRFWDAREHLAEGRQMLARLLKMDTQSIHLKLRARLLFVAAVLAGEQGDYRSAQELLEESLERCVEMEDRRGVAVALNALAVNARDRGDLTAASLLLGQCIEIWRDLGGPGDIARALSNHANVIKLQNQYERASALYQECLELFRQAGDDAGVAWTMNYQGDVAREAGDLTAARRHYEQSLAGFRRLHDGWGIASVLSDFANLNCDLGRHADAERLFGESIRVFQELDHKRGVARVLECIAANAAAQSRADQALRLAGAAAALRQRLGAPLVPSEQARLEKVLEFARRSLPGPEALNAWMEGWAMPVERAVREALGPDGRAAQESRVSG
jgi:tetratricopeptide (TPR) repeat protein